MTAAGETTEPTRRLDGALFLVWGWRNRGSRSRAISAKLGIDTHFVSSTTRRGLLAAPLKYPSQALKTIGLLWRERPRLVFVQNPPSFAPLLIMVYAALTSARFVVDAHSDAMLAGVWTRPRWLYRQLARRALATIVTNQHFANVIGSWGARAIVVRDIPTAFAEGSFDVGDGFVLTMVNTFAFDEPLDQVLTAARDLPDVTFFVTGDKGRGEQLVPSQPPPNVHFTGFLAEDQYYGLLRASDAVMSLTTRDHTMQRGACEALWLGKPIITSQWPLLTDYFSMGTVHVDNTAAGIRAGVGEMRRGLDDYRKDVVELQRLRQKQWDTALASLLDLLNVGNERLGERPEDRR